MSKQFRSEAGVTPLLNEIRGIGAILRELQRRASLPRVAGGWGVLAQLDRSGPSRVSALARELHVDASVASRQLAGLEEAGYVERERDPEDGRAWLYDLTGEGTAGLARVRSTLSAELDAAVEDWDAEDVEVLVTGLARLNRDYRRVIGIGADDAATDAGETTEEVPA
ncbi:MarR family transcriptional regulator [Thermoleophilia bacterium SCSIO 60948]|nr:MarR family transcriptional regulator [Thermoleophilia bacterium SCSIO 60948]